MAHMGFAVFHGPWDLLSPNEMFHQFAGDIKESSEEGKVSLGLGSVLSWELKGLVRCVPSRGGGGGPGDILQPARMAEW